MDMTQFKGLNPHMITDMQKRFPGITPLEIYAFSRVLTYEERLAVLRGGKWPHPDSGSGQQIHDLKLLIGQ